MQIRLSNINGTLGTQAAPALPRLPATGGPEAGSRAPELWAQRVAGMATSLGKVNGLRVCNNPRNPYPPDACCGPTDLEPGAEVSAAPSYFHMSPVTATDVMQASVGQMRAQQLAVRNV